MEERNGGSRKVRKLLPRVNDPRDNEACWLRHAPDQYGYRGQNERNSGVFTDPMGVRHVLGSGSSAPTFKERISKWP